MIKFFSRKFGKKIIPKTGNNISSINIIIFCQIQKFNYYWRISKLLRNILGATVPERL